LTRWPSGGPSRAACEVARQQGDRAASARLAARLADALLAEGALDDAARIVAESLADARSSGLSEPPAELLLRQAILERRRGYTVASAATLGALLAPPEAMPHVVLQARIEMAGLLEDGGDLERAETAYREALTLARERSDHASEARALIGAFGIAARTGRAAEAEAPLAEARAIAERLGDGRLVVAARAAQALAAINSPGRSSTTSALNFNPPGKSSTTSALNFNSPGRSSTTSALNFNSPGRSSTTLPDAGLTA
jgi:tetratricopeptide (TPR) repeat protein